MNDTFPALAEALRATVAKDAHNSHGGYDYATADAIYAHARRAVFGAGLTVYQSETGLELTERANRSGKKSTWAQVTYELGLAPVGQTPADPETVTVLVQVTGSQSLGAARTYALKYWLRGKFLLATGDEREDLDSVPAEFDRPARPDRPARNGRPDPETGFKDWAAKRRAKLAPMGADELAVEYLRVGMEKGKTEEALTAYLEKVFGSGDPREWKPEQLEKMRGWLLS